MSKLISMTRHSDRANVECKESPIVEDAPNDRREFYVTQNYAHRRNADGSFDSICLHCFQTGASASIDAALAEINAALAQNEMQYRSVHYISKSSKAGDM